MDCSHSHCILYATQELLAYYYTHGHSSVRQRDGKLGRFATQMRTAHRSLRQGKTSLDNYIEKRIELMEAVDFEWSINEAPEKVSWEERFGELVQFKRKYGHCRVNCRKGRKFYCGALGVWVATQRATYQRIKLGKETMTPVKEQRIQRLKKIGFEWKVQGNQYS